MACSLQLNTNHQEAAMTPESIPELDTKAFRRAIAVALGLPIEGEPPRVVALRSAPAWDPLASVDAEPAEERKVA